MTAYRFLEPLDVLILRGNRLFGDAGSYGESLVPPWPSVAAGAIRSQMLATEGIDLSAFATGKAPHPQLGTPEQPGSFTVSAFTLARRAGEDVESLHPLPADLVATRGDTGVELDWLRPASPASGISSSAPLPFSPVLTTDTPAKPEAGVWLTQSGWQQYLNGELPAIEARLAAGSLWQLDPRVGVGLDPEKGRAEDGKLFTVQAVAFQPGHGFLVAIEGANPPGDGSLRLGGDGRGAAVSACDYSAPEPDYEAIARAGRARLILTSPGLFPGGWRLPGSDADHRVSLGDVTGRLVCAAVPRAEVISGWDLAAWRPKSAQRVAPVGSVYWLEELQGSADELRKLVAVGLWPDEGYDAQRCAEGFNRFTWGVWT